MAALCSISELFWGLTFHGTHLTYFLKEGELGYGGPGLLLSYVQFVKILVYKVLTACAIAFLVFAKCEYRWFNIAGELIE